MVLGIVLLVILWTAIQLAVTGEVGIQTREMVGIRLWVVSAEGNQGLAFSRSRRESTEGSQDICLQTTVGYLLRKMNSPQPALRYCECYTRFSGQLEYVGDCDP